MEMEFDVKSFVEEVEKQTAHCGGCIAEMAEACFYRVVLDEMDSLKLSEGQRQAVLDYLEVTLSVIEEISKRAVRPCWNTNENVTRFLPWRSARTKIRELRLSF